MGKIPYLYEKLRAFIEQAELRKAERDKVRSDIASRFRITVDDVPRIINEMNSYGMIKKKTRQKIEFR